jgi:hypothetical protein
LSNVVTYVNPLTTRGIVYGYAGGDSDAQTLDPIGSGNAENGSKTGVAISFDTWQGNRLPDTGAGGIPGPDVEGFTVRVDDKTLIQVPMPTRNAGCADNTSLQTGTWLNDGGASFTHLEWCPLEVELTVDAKINVTWKGRKILENFQVAAYSPHKGRLLLAGRTGGNNQYVHFDNISLETVPAIEPLVKSLTVNPDLRGWTLILEDFPPSNVTNVTEVIWNGVNVTSSVNISQAAPDTTIAYTQVDRLPANSANQVTVTFQTSLGQTITAVANATTQNYFVMPSDYALPLSAVSGQPRGIALGQAWQTIAHNQNSQGENRLNWTEEQILGVWGTNLLVAGPASSDVIDFQNGGPNGNFQVGGSLLAPPLWDGADYSIQSTFGFAANPSKTTDEDGSVEWFAYVNFPSAGDYEMVVNSDDGFRLTTARHANDRMGNVISLFNGGRGAGTGTGAGTVQRLVVEQPGVYPIRGLMFNRGGGFNVEWYTRSGDQLYLVNSNSTPEALQAWTSATGTGAFVQSALPVRDAIDVLPTQGIAIELGNGTATVNAGTIVLKVDGNTVTPTITGGATTKVELAPIGSNNWWRQGLHNVELTFTDSASTAYSYAWSFTVGAYQFYQAPFGEGGTWNTYLIMRSQRSWVQAEEAARSLVEPLSGQNKPGHLVTIHSAQEADFVRWIAVGSSVWIGLTDNEAYGGEETGTDAAAASQVPPVTGKWVWVTGEPYTYARWNGGEPNNSGVGEDAIELVDNGNFNDNANGIPPEGTPFRQFVVEFETRQPQMLAAVPYIFPPEPIPGPDGCGDSFGIRVYRNAGGMGSIAAGVGAFYHPSATYVDTSAPLINFNDLDGTAGGGGIFGGDVALPDNRTGNDDNLVMTAKTRIQITESGDYTFGVHSDDGFALRIRGSTWTSSSGGGLIAAGDASVLLFPLGTGDANTRGVINLSAGTHDLEFLWFEGGGGAYVELYAAKGAFQCDTETSAWRLVGYKPQDPPATFVDVGVSTAGWTVEHSVPGAAGAVNDIATAEAALAGAATVANVFQLNYTDPQGGGGPGCSAPFPQDTEAADDNFAVRATAQLVIPVAGTYHFGFAGDDGGYLQIEGQTWDSIVATADPAQGVINGDRIQFNIPTGNSRTVGAITLAQGTYTIRALFWETGGGAWWWVFGGQPGGQYSVLTANNSPLVVDAGVSIAPCVGGPELSIGRDGANVVVTYTGTLQSADTVNGTYTDVSGATSPYSVPATGSSKFFRARE